MSLLLAVGGCGGSEITPPRAPGDDASSRAAAAATVLRRLADGLQHHRRGEVLALAASGHDAALRAVYDNVEELGLEDVAFRFVAATGSTAGSTWHASVTVSWRLPTYDARATQVTSRMTFRTQAGRTRLAGFGGGDERSALWLTAPLSVRRSPDTLVMVAAGSATRDDRLARRAVLAVREVLPDWRGRLVVEVPPSQSALESLLHAPHDEYRQIAAVTTTVDGSQARGAPVHVFLNPAVFDRLGPRGSQVVLSHETTHVATDATFADMPTWLLEGFADYVALAHADIPVRTAARQILARVRRDGPPSHLPSTADLDPSSTGLGATYEEAWTVCRLIGQTYGQQKMVDLYDAVDAGTPVADAFRTVLGTTQAAFVRAWRSDLAALAAGGAG